MHQCKKKKKVPKRSEAQKTNAKIKCGRIYRKYRNKDFIIDDESNFTLSHSNINGNNIYYSNNDALTPTSVKIKTKSKYEEKVLVWICISVKGVSKPYIHRSKTAISQFTYLNECIIKRLIPFIDSNHSDHNYLFWPNLASSHYSNMVVDYLNEKKVNYMPKIDNPANLPEVKVIEDFWNILKGHVYKNNWQAQNIDQLQARIIYCL